MRDRSVGSQWVGIGQVLRKADSGTRLQKRLSEFLVTCKNSGSPFRWRQHADGALIHRPGMSLRQAQRPDTCPVRNQLSDRTCDLTSGQKALCETIREALRWLVNFVEPLVLRPVSATLRKG